MYLLHHCKLLPCPALHIPDIKLCSCPAYPFLPACASSLHIPCIIACTFLCIPCIMCSFPVHTWKMSKRLHRARFLQARLYPKARNYDRWTEQQISINDVIPGVILPWFPLPRPWISLYLAIIRASVVLGVQTWKNSQALKRGLCSIPILTPGGSHMYTLLWRASLIQSQFVTKPCPNMCSYAVPLFKKKKKRGSSP